MRTKAKIVTEQLPPTPVTPQMREEIVEAARLRGCSIATIQREAFSLFLQRNVSVNDILISTNEQERAER